jgi:hypothetical protein
VLSEAGTYLLDLFSNLDHTESNWLRGVLNRIPFFGGRIAFSSIQNVFCQIDISMTSTKRKKLISCFVLHSS